MNPPDVLELFGQVADAVGAALAQVEDWGESGVRPGQYLADLAADAAAVDRLLDAGLGVLSEESGEQGIDRELVVMLDPLDGSTNASLGIPWYATSLCAFDEAGPYVALVADQARGRRYTAVRHQGAWRDGHRLRRIRPVAALSGAVVGISGMPSRPLGWRQFRAMGAAALDLCLVAEGVLDGWVDCSPDAHGVWDYAGGALVCLEAGGAVADALGRDLMTRSHSVRRTPVAAGDRTLLDELLAARAAAQ